MRNIDRAGSAIKGRVAILGVDPRAVVLRALGS